VSVGKLTYILIQGFVIGAGPCVLICAPILLPYIAGTQRTWQQGFRAALVFGLARLLVYTLLGGVVGYIGYYLFQLFYNRLWGIYLWTFAGIFIITLGMLILLGREINNPVCRFLQKHALENNVRSLFLLGLIIGFSPCLPLLAVLTEIMFMADRFYSGFIYGFAFGLGTVVSPLLLMGALAPLIPGKLIRSDKAMRIFNAVCGGLLIMVGIYIIWQKLI